MIIRFSKSNIFNKILFIGFILTTGTFIYFVDRSSSIRLNSWIGVFSINAPKLELPYFIKYSVPDGLFAFAFMISLNFIWRWRVPFIWEAISIIFLFASELLQKNYLVGTYDQMDFVSISCGIIITQIISIYYNYKNKHYAQI